MNGPYKDLIFLFLYSFYHYIWSKHSRREQVKFVEEILHGPFLNTLTHISWKDLSVLLNEMFLGSI